MRFLHFLSYHNAVPIALGVLFLGAGGVFAATNPEVIYSEEETVISIDNTYLVNKDFETFTPQVRIVDVSEDEEYYYVDYQFETIDLEDYVWQDVRKSEEMKVSKDDLGPYRDLGIYVMEQLQQKVEREIAYLKEVQEIERRQVSNKTVATAYGGLVGALLNDTTETLPGYTPVVTPPERDRGQVASAAGASSGSSSSTSDSGNQQGNSGNTNTSTGGAGAPVIQILGNNPAWIPLKSRYSDLGAIVTDDKDVNIGIHVFFDGKEVQTVSLDTSTTTEYTIIYRATDTDDNTGEATHTVVIYNPETDTPPEVAPNVPVVPETYTQSETETPQADDEESVENEQEESATTTPETSVEEGGSEEEETTTPEEEENATNATITPSTGDDTSLDGGEDNQGNTGGNTEEENQEDAGISEEEGIDEENEEVSEETVNEEDDDEAEEPIATTTPSE